jgi:SnoaL-like domain
MDDAVSAEAAAAAWIAAWNAHDLDAIMDHYAGDVVFRADTVVSRWNRPDGTLRGKSELREHFRRGLERAPALHFTLRTVLTCPGGYAVFYERENGNVVIDAVEVDAHGRGVRVQAYYASRQP